MSNFELNLLKAIGHHIPRFPHSAAIYNRILKPFYNRKKRKPVISDVYGFQFELNPVECVDANLLFSPQLYDPVEVQLMLTELDDKDNFIDIGANIGFYSLIATKKIKKGRVVAIEANPITYLKLKKNIERNNLNVEHINLGVSSCTEILMLNTKNKLNSGSHSFVYDDDSETVPVECKSLEEILTDKNISSVKMLKIDVEGFEFTIFDAFFKSKRNDLFPEYIITEYGNHNVNGDHISLIIKQGYIQIYKSKHNMIFRNVE